MIKHDSFDHNTRFTNLCWSWQFHSSEILVLVKGIIMDTWKKRLKGLKSFKQVTEYAQL